MTAPRLLINSMEGLWPILAQTPMIRSMTGFARRERQFPQGLLAWELKTVNHRFLEIGMRLPEEFRVGEAEFRQGVAASVRRGKVECSLHFRPAVTAAALEVDAELLASLLQRAQTIAAQAGPAARGAGAHAREIARTHRTAGRRRGPRTARTRTGDSGAAPGRGRRDRSPARPRDRSAQDLRRTGTRRAAPGFLDAGAESRSQHLVVEVSGYRDHPCGRRHEGVDRADARASAERRVAVDGPRSPIRGFGAVRRGQDQPGEGADRDRAPHSFFRVLHHAQAAAERDTRPRLPLREHGALPRDGRARRVSGARAGLRQLLRNRRASRRRSACDWRTAVTGNRLAGCRTGARPTAGGAQHFHSAAFTRLTGAET